MKLENFTDLQSWAVEQWEDAELGDSRRTDRAIAVVAVRLLQLRELSRTHPDLPSKDFVPKIMISILVSRRFLPSQNLTVGEFWKCVARLGGFLGRKSDGFPGWQTLWRGWNRLMDMYWAVDFTAQSS